jgi:hypothetical protein
MRRISEETKRKQGMGTGSGAEYKPYIQAREFNSLGTTSNAIDWKTGRTMELLSQGEAKLWLILRWDDTNLDIREQCRLDLEDTLRISDEFGIRHPKNRTTCMTTDLLVTKNDHSEVAYSLKTSRKSLNNIRTTEKLFIEKCYWIRSNVEFKLMFKDELNNKLAQNIRLVTAFYKRSSVFDDMSLLKHLIATKQIVVDMESRILAFDKLYKEYKDVIKDGRYCIENR